MKRIAGAILSLAAVPVLLHAQIPNEHASDNAKAKVAAHSQHHPTTTIRGTALGLDNRPVTPATPAVPATRATRAVPSSGGGRATPAIPATPATPAVPASPAHKPSNPGQSGSHRP